MSCRREELEMMLARVRYGEDSPEYESARGRYLRCMEPIHAGRASHAASWDERLYLHYLFLQEAWEALVGKLDIPRPGDPFRTDEVRKEIFADSKTAMLFSKALADAFKKSGIELKDDETFACHISVVKKPTTVSEARRMLSAGAPGEMSGVMEPLVMERVMEELEKERIRYPKQG